MTDLSCTDYTEKSIVVRGDTKSYKEHLKNLGGKYNANLRDGAGWIFSKKVEDKVLSFIASGKLDGEEKLKQKSVSGTSATILSVVENAIKSMDVNERLAFVANVSRIASGQAYIVSKPTNVKINIRKVEDQDEDEEKHPTKPVVNTDFDDSDEEVVQPKRLLQRR